MTDTTKLPTPAHWLNAIMACVSSSKISEYDLLRIEQEAWRIAALAPPSGEGVDKYRCVSCGKHIPRDECHACFGSLHGATTTQSAPEE